MTDRHALTPAEVRAAAAWRAAAEDLQIAVEAPWQPPDRAAGAPVFVVRIEGFGKRLGAVCRGIDAPRRALIEARSWAIAHGFYFAVLGETYLSFNREAWTAMLDDWGWHGDSGAPPAWYTGTPWGH